MCVHYTYNRSYTKYYNLNNNNLNVLPVGYLCGVIMSKIQIIIKTEITTAKKNIFVDNENYIRRAMCCRSWYSDVFCSVSIHRKNGLRERCWLASSSFFLNYITWKGSSVYFLLFVSFILFFFYLRFFLYILAILSKTIHKIEIHFFLDTKVILA